MATIEPFPGRPTNGGAPSPRTRVKRLPDRARYDAPAIEAILDEGLVCHVGFEIEGQPYVIPTAYGRVEHRLYIHGSAASRMLRSLGSGVPVCVTVTLLDGLVLARSAFHHSMNYRSVVVLGVAVPITEPAEKLAALEAIVEHIVPGRTREVRRPNEQELRKTLVLSLSLEESSAKVRSGPPLDDEPDYALPVWCGEIPLPLSPGRPQADARVLPHVELPDYVRAYRRPGC